MAPIKRQQGGDNGSRKRSKTSNTTIIYRGVRTEMKYIDTVITYTAVSSLVVPIAQIAAGAARNARSGNRCKLHRVEAIISTPVAGSQPIRVELVNPKDPSVAPTFVYDALLDNDTNTSMYRRFLHAGTEKNPTGYFINHKLPLGLVQTYGLTTGSSVNKGNLCICLATQTNSTFTCQTRVWFTDA